MKDVLWLVGKRLSMIFRSRKNVMLYLFTPLIGIFIALLVYGGDQGTTLRVAVVDEEQSSIAADTIAFLEGLENVEVSELPEKQAGEMLTAGKLDSIMTLEQGYEESVLQGRPDYVRITSIKGAEVTGYLKAYLQQYIDSIATMSVAAGGDVLAFKQMYEGYQQADFQLSTQFLEDQTRDTGMTNQTIGFLIMIMLVSAGNLSELILVEKENRTYFRLLSTPLNTRKYVMSNVLVNMLVMTIQVVLTLTIMKGIFHIGVNVAFWQAALVMLLFSLISVGLSLVIISFSNSRSAANALQNVIITPTVMISGCYWPVELMPDTLQKIAYFFPQRWTLDTLTKLQEGTAFGSLYVNFAILLAFAAAFFLLAMYGFSRNRTIQSFV